MIKIIKGIYGYRNKNGIIEPKTTESPAFSLTDVQEERLVKIGVAAYANEVVVAPVQQPLEGQNENAKKAMLERMNVNDLKKLAKEKGVEQGKKEDMIAAILELEEESEDDREEDDDMPEFDAQMPS